MPLEDGQVVARNVDGKELLRRPLTLLERAAEEHGGVQWTNEWVVHPACANPPAHSGVCTYQFGDGLRWCFKCQVAWRHEPRRG